MTIEKAEFSDLEKILSLQKLAYSSEAEICNDYSIPPLVQTLDGIIEDFKNKLILKAISNGAVVVLKNLYFYKKLGYRVFREEQENEK